MKIAVAQIEVKAGNPTKNLAKVLVEIEREKDKGIELIVFSEMVVGGYLLGDEWENNSLMEELMEANEIIREASQGITVIWGNVYMDKNKKGEDGRARKYNSVFIAQNRQWVSNGVFEGKSYKSLMPKYREFDDERHFYSLIKEANERKVSVDSLLQPFEVETKNGKLKVGLILCEDMWHQDYFVNPSEVLVKNGAEMIINISCSPWTWRKNKKRHSVVKEIVEKTQVPFVYCNNTGIQNNGKNIFLFDGNSTVYNKTGEIVSQANDYNEETIVVEMDLNSKELINWNPGSRIKSGMTSTSVRRGNDMHEIASVQSTEIRNDEVRRAGMNENDLENLHMGLVYGVQRFFDNLPNKKVVIGLSGGIDSAVVASILVEALGNENVLAVNMPSMFNSELTKDAARKLADNLGIEYKVISIQESVDLTIRQLEAVGIEVTDFVKENIQARDRGSRILAAVAAGVNAVFVNNGNKTETALGYCTLYGDVDGALAIIADLYKGQVCELAEYINEQKGKQIIPEEIMISYYETIVSSPTLELPIPR